MNNLPWASATAIDLRKSLNTKTFNETIQQFLTSLELTDRQANLVAERQKAVRECAEASSLIDVKDSRLIGSYQRESQIRPVILGAPNLDVDALLILDPSSRYNLNSYWHINDGGTKLLQDTYAALAGFQALSVQIDRPSITIKWKDMKMELTPAFPAEGGGYLIPAKHPFSTTWTLTDPFADAAALTQANKFCRNEFKPLIKMLKCWDRHWEKPIGSFAIETVAFHSATFVTYCGYAFEIPFFFGRLLDYDGYYIRTPSGIGDAPLISLGPNRRLVEVCKKVADLAYEAEKKGDHQTATSLLSDLFGKPFPGAS